MTRAHGDAHQLRSTVVRIFNVVGPRQAPQAAVVPLFLDQAMRCESITVNGDGRQSRCFTDVRDVVAALVRLAECDEACGEIVNIGTRREQSISDLAHMVKSTTRSDSNIVSVPYGLHVVPSRTPSISKARQLIGFAPVHRFEDTVNEMIALAGEAPPTAS